MSAVVEGRASTLVLTSENSAEFYAKRLDLAPEPAAPAPVKTEGEQPVVESAEAKAAAAEREAAEQQTESDPDKKQKLNLRFSELSKQRDEANAKAEKAAADAKADREARELAEKRAKELETKLNPPAQAETDEPDPEPKPEQFKDAFEYAKALAEWSTEKALRERDAKEADARTKAEKEKVVSAFLDRQTAFKAATADYEAVIAASPVAISTELRDAILDSDVGPQLLYHFAQNPAEADRINKLKVGPALRELGKLEAKVASVKAPGTSEASPSKPVAAAPEISRAPAPINPVRGSGSAIETSTVDGNGVFHGTYADWKAQRKAGKIK